MSIRTSLSAEIATRRDVTCATQHAHENTGGLNRKIIHISHKRFEAARSLKRRSVERRLSFIIRAARENRRAA